MRLTATRTLSNVSKCHRLLGAKRSAAKTMFDEHWALNSGSVLSRNSSNSFIIVRMLLELTSAKLSSRALRLMDTSGSCIQQINAAIQQLCTYITYIDIVSLKACPFKVFPHSEFNFYDHSPITNYFLHHDIPHFCAEIHSFPSETKVTTSFNFCSPIYQDFL